MSFNAIEVSDYDSQPYYLYEFSNGSARWLYTSSEDSVTRGGDVFIPEQIAPSETGNTTELNKQTFKVLLPSANDVAQMFNFYPPTAPTLLTVWEHHVGDAESLVVWTGRVIAAEYLGAQSELRCEPISTSIRRLGLRRLFQRQCPHVLYGQSDGGCLLNAETFKTTATVGFVDGLSIHTVASLVDGRFNGGMMSWVTSSGLQWRFITGNTPSIISVNFPFAAAGDAYGRHLTAGTEINLYPGCNHTMTDCIDKFDNLDNYGGQPFTPWDNPFNGTTLY